jgi:hypothetical protein
MLKPSGIVLTAFSASCTNLNQYKMGHLLLILLISALIIADVVGKTDHQRVKRMLPSPGSAKYEHIYRRIYYSPSKPLPRPIPV